MAKKKSGHGEIKLVKDLVYVNLFASEKIRPSILIRYVALEELYGISSGGIALYNQHVYHERHKHNIKKFFELSENIKLRGIQNPVTYSQLDSGFSVRNGNHCIAVALFLNIDYIKTREVNRLIEDRRKTWEEVEPKYGEKSIKLLYNTFLELKERYYD